MEIFLAFLPHVWWWCGYIALVVKHPKPPFITRWILFLALGPFAWFMPPIWVYEEPIDYQI